MKTEISTTIKENNVLKYDVFFEIIDTVLLCSNLSELRVNIDNIKNSIGNTFFIYFGSSHCSIHEILMDGSINDKRILFIYE